MGTSMDDGLVRLTEPLVRDGGRLRPASWEEALTRAACSKPIDRGLAAMGLNAGAATYSA